MPPGRESEIDAVIAAIKAGANVWCADAALDVLRQHFSGRQGITARSIYMALAEVAADQIAPATFVASDWEIGRIAAAEAHLVGSYLADFVHIGLLKVEERGDGKLVLTLLDPATGCPREYPEVEAVEAPTHRQPMR